MKLLSFPGLDETLFSSLILSSPNLKACYIMEIFDLLKKIYYCHAVILNLVGRWLREYLIAQYYLIYYLGVCLLGRGSQTK